MMKLRQIINKIYHVKPHYRFFSGALLIISTLFASHAFAHGDERVEGETKIFEFHLLAHDLNSFQKMIEGHDPLDKNDWKNLDLTRHNLEILIFTVAPVLGGCDCEIVLKSFDMDTPHARSVEMVRNGAEVSHPVSVFDDDPRINDDFYVTQPLLPADEFFVGLYTFEGRNDILKLTEASEIEALTFVVGHDWLIDAELLDAVGAKYVKADNWETALNMIIAGRADVIMQPFTANDDFGFYDESVEENFVPIPNKRIAFDQGRRFVVSKKNPDGAEFFDHLNKGIEILDGEDNFLTQAHIWAGVINPKTNRFDTIFQ